MESISKQDKLLKELMLKYQQIAKGSVFDHLKLIQLINEYKRLGVKFDSCMQTLSADPWFHGGPYNILYSIFQPYNVLKYDFGQRHIIDVLFLIKKTNDGSHGYYLDVNETEWSQLFQISQNFYDQTQLIQLPLDLEKLKLSCRQYIQQNIQWLETIYKSNHESEYFPAILPLVIEVYETKALQFCYQKFPELAKSMLFQKKAVEMIHLRQCGKTEKTNTLGLLLSKMSLFAYKYEGLSSYPKNKTVLESHLEKSLSELKKQSQSSFTHTSKLLEKKKSEENKTKKIF